MKPDLETRIWGVELRVKRDANKTTIVGHAAVFDQLSEDLGGFREEVAPGAFAQTIREDDIRALFNHQPSYVLGRNRSGTLVMREDDKGLYFEIDTPDTQQARDVVALIERGDVTGNSFTFRTLDDEWRTEGGEERRRLKKVRLFDVGPVTFPAYPQTDLALRSLEAWREQREKAPGAPKLNAWRRRLAVLD